jgi:hypothetical protein
MTISLLDGTLKVNIFFELKDCEYGDNVCLSVVEKCPDDEKVFRADETNLYLTPKQARKLASVLVSAAEDSETYCSSKENKHEKSIQA